jgi:hypothetical protein
MNYPIISFNQYDRTQNDDVMHLFAAPASEISKWAGIPRKGWRIRMLYQRWISASRKSQLSTFWKIAAGVGLPDCTVCPTAIVVALQEKAKITDGKIDLDYASPIIGIPNDDEKLKCLASIIYPRLKYRIKGKDLSNLDAFEKSPLASKIPNNLEDGVLEFCYQLLVLANNPADFISQNSLTKSDITEIISSLDAISRPALVIDGQHRLEGARITNGGKINLPIVVIENCNWTDQIFQFVIINDKAKPIDTSILNDIFASSLTKDEQNQMRDTFKRVDVEIEIKIAAVLAGKNKNSPFYKMIKLNLEGEPPGGSKGIISDNTVQYLIDSGGGARGFRSDDEFFDTLVSSIYTKSEWEEWTNGKWNAYWFAMWSKIRDVYTPLAKKQLSDKDFEIWNYNKISNLTMGVGLKVFQNFIIERLCVFGSKRKTYSDLLTDTDEDKDPELVKSIRAKAKKFELPDTADEFANLVEKEVLNFIPVKVFTTPWLKSRDTDEGRKSMLSNLNEIYGFESATPKTKWRATGRFFSAE